MDFLSSGALPQSLQAESWAYPLGPETILAAKDARKMAVWRVRVHTLWLLGMDSGRKDGDCSETVCKHRPCLHLPLSRVVQQTCSGPGAHLTRLPTCFCPHLPIRECEASRVVGLVQNRWWQPLTVAAMTSCYAAIKGRC